MNSVQNSYNPYDLSSYRVLLDEDSINSVKKPNYVADKEEKKSNKKAIVTTSVITGGLTLIVTTLALLQRGKGVRIDKLKKYLDNALNKFKGQKSLSKFQQIFVKIVEKSKKGLDKLSSLNNFASVKDVPICRGLKKCKLGARLCDGITDLFGKMTHNTLTNSYNKAEKAFTEVFDSLKRLDAKTLASKKPADIIEINGIKKTVAEWQKISLEYQSSLLKKMQENFSVNAHTNRFGKLKDSLSNLQDEFWNKLFKIENGNKPFKETIKEVGKKTQQSVKEMSETFVLEDLVSPQKLDYVTDVYKHKSAITNTFSDRCEQAFDIMQSIKIESTEANTYRDMLKKISGTLKQLMKTKGQNSEVIMEELTTQSKELIETLSKSSDVSNKEKLIGIIKSNIENLTNAAQKGQVEQILEIQKGLLSPKEYAELEKKFNSAVNKLNRSARLEGGDFFDKMRDISSGSAVTDVLLSGCAPVLGTTAAMVKADSKQQRRGTLLKMGIPLIGGVAVSLGCTAGIIPIGISLALGLGSSMVLNRIGKAINAKLEEKDMIDDLNQKTESAA